MRECDNRGGREVAGLIIVLVGFGLLLNTMNIMPAFPFMGYVQRFWLPAMFIGLGVLLLSRNGNNGKFGGLFFIIFGFFFLMGTLNAWRFEYQKWIGPGILIWIGIALLMRSQRPYRSRMDNAAPSSSAPPPASNPDSNMFGSSRRDRFDRGNMASSQVIDSSDYVRATVILGMFNRKCPTQQFRGGELTAIMGGGKLDLRECHIQDREAILDIFTLMGGLEIQVPPGWIVEPRFTPILGGYSDRTSKQASSDQRLIINGTAIMGGVTILN